MDAILHDHLPKAPWLDPATWRLPGMQPLATEDWLIRDEVFCPQMALRDQLLAERADDVLATLPRAVSAAAECLDLVLEALGQDPAYTVGDSSVTRPDGIVVPIDRDQALRTIGRLQQADVCVMQPGPDGHVLTGANLCFPAYWTLAEKLGKPLARIHVPVPEYDSDIEKRVQRLFDALQPGRLLWRANANLHDDPTLFAPVRETDKHPHRNVGTERYVRSERQTLRKLPRSGAVVFTIHTYMIALDRLTKDQRAAMADAGLTTG